MAADPDPRYRSTDIPAAGPDRRHPHRSFVIAHAFEMGVAVSGFLTSIQFITDPRVRDAVAVGSIGNSFAWYWTILYLIGSAGIIIGLVTMQDRIELAGLSCFASAALVNGVSLLQVRSTNSVYVVLIFFSFTSGSIARAYTLLALRRLTPGARRQGPRG